MLYFTENIINPIRTHIGRAKISVGKTTYDKLPQYFIMIDDLAWLFRVSPSFVMLFPSAADLDKDGDSANTFLVYPKYADKNLEFNVMAKGTADMRTYFFGEPKEGRLFDMFYRLFETGFKLYNFEGLEKSPLKLTSKTEISISSKDYEHPSIVSGDTKKFKVRARVSRKN